MLHRPAHFASCLALALTLAGCLQSGELPRARQLEDAAVDDPDAATDGEPDASPDASVVPEPDAASGDGEVSPEPPDPNLGALGEPCVSDIQVEHLGGSFAPAVGQCRQPLVCSALGKCIEEVACRFPLREPCVLSLSARADLLQLVATPGFLYWPEACKLEDGWSSEDVHDGRIVRLDLSTGESEVLATKLHEASALAVDAGDKHLALRHYMGGVRSLFTMSVTPRAAPRERVEEGDLDFTLHDGVVWKRDPTRSDVIRLVGTDLDDAETPLELVLQGKAPLDARSLFVEQHVFVRDEASQLRAFDRSTKKLKVLDAQGGAYGDPIGVHEGSLLAFQDGTAKLSRLPLDGGEALRLDAFTSDGAGTLRGRFFYTVRRLEHGTVIVREDVSGDENPGPQLVAGVPEERGDAVPYEYALVRSIANGVLWVSSGEEAQLHFVPLAD
jgi:hypothetical protein